jgi:hypothetical protein
VATDLGTNLAWVEALRAETFGDLPSNREIDAVVAAGNELLEKLRADHAIAHAALQTKKDEFYKAFETASTIISNGQHRIDEFAKKLDAVAAAMRG